MCFSANASFGAGVVLTVIGFATIKKTQYPSQLLFASIPLIFGVQQVAEGVIWLTLPNPDYMNTQKIFTYIYLFFAQVLWPLWVPLAILLFEKNAAKKSVQKILVGAGAIVGICMTFCLIVFHAEAKIVGQHIIYLQDYPVSLNKYGMLLYALATIVPPFFSQLKRMWMFGISILISYIVTTIFYEHYILSVWCFFSAIISLSIYAIIAETTTKRGLPSQIIYS